MTTPDHQAEGLSRRGFITGLGAGAFCVLAPTSLPFSGEALAGTLEHRVEQFPALAFDPSGRLWSAVIERPMPRQCIRIDIAAAGNGGAPKTVRVAEKGVTGMGAPVLQPLADGCLLAFPVENENRWRIALAVMQGGGSTAPKLKYLDAGGTSNMTPAVAVSGDRACMLWESNAGEKRGIYASWVDSKGAGKPMRLTTEAANTYNPAVVALEDGSLFAAWDSYRNVSADLYGRAYRNGKWEDERRLTESPFIERHAHLAVKDNEVWMAWQAHTFTRCRPNNTQNHRVVVARVTGNGMASPKGMFDAVSPKGVQLDRPRIAFDLQGRLWLTASRGMTTGGARRTQTQGWEPMVWCYAGSSWSAGMKLLPKEQYGRWHPIPLVFSPKGKHAARVQRDNLPQTWAQQGKHPDWLSHVRKADLSTVKPPAAAKLETEPLRMPDTKFSIAEHLVWSAAALPRQKWEIGGKPLQLCWGSLHEHTDISVCNRHGNLPAHDLYATAQDIEGQDFCAITDHGYNFDPPQWSMHAGDVRACHDPSRFITFLAQEWTSSKNPADPKDPRKMRRYGHHNLIFLDPRHPRFHDSYDGNVSPTALWKKLKDVSFICIPHQLADWKGKGKWNPPTDWNHADERLQPVAEIYQARGSYEYLGCPRQSKDGAPFKGHYLQDAWARGIVIGVIASPDHPGGTGRAGVWSEDLSREALFKAIRARHTFGTTGPKMGLKFSGGGGIMGDKLKRPDGGIRFKVESKALKAIDEVVIFRNNKPVFTTKPNEKEVSLDWTDARPIPGKKLWYYARIQIEDKNLAWSSPIWFRA